MNNDKMIIERIIAKLTGEYIALMYEIDFDMSKATQDQEDEILLIEEELRYWEQEIKKCQE